LNETSAAFRKIPNRSAGAAGRGEEERKYQLRPRFFVTWRRTLAVSKMAEIDRFLLGFWTSAQFYS